MLLNSGVTVMGSNRQVGSITPMANLITPADENRTHYFWNMQRNQQVGNLEADQKIKMGVAHTFKNEDGVMVKWCQELMCTHDLFSLNPVLLAGDAGAVRARRILARLIAEEQAAAVVAA